MAEPHRRARALSAHTPRTPLEFIDVLSNPYAQQGGHMVVAHRPASAPETLDHHWYPAGRAYRAAADVRALGDLGDVYLGVATYGRHNGRHKRTRDSVTALGWLWADLDEHPPGGDLPPPTLLVETSPGRRQALWALHGLPAVIDVEERARAIAAACGLGLDAVAANQLLRIPGTVNHGALVYVEEYRHKAVYRLDAFAHLAPGPEPRRLAAATALDLADTEQSLEALAHAYSHLTERTRDSLEGRDVLSRRGTDYRSGSEGDQALITALVRAGLTAGEAGGAFLATARGQACAARHGWPEARRKAAVDALAAAALVADTPGTIAIPRSLVDPAAPIGTYAVAVYATLAAYAIGSGRAWAAQKTMADDLQCSVDSVKRALGELRRRGILPDTDDHVGRARLYAIASGLDGIALPVATLRALRDAEGVLGAAIAAAIAAGHDTQRTIATALGASVDTVAPCLCRLAHADLLTIAAAGPGGQQHYRLLGSVA